MQKNVDSQNKSTCKKSKAWKSSAASQCSQPDWLINIFQIIIIPKWISTAIINP